MADHRASSAGTEIRRNRLVAAVLALMVLLSCWVALLSRNPSGGKAIQPTTLSEQSSSAGAVPRQTPSAAAAPTVAVSPASTGASVAVPSQASGTFTRVLVPGATSATTGRVVTFGLEVENGMGANTTQIAAAVRTALMDPRGWQTVDKVRFEQVTPAQVAAGQRPRIDIVVASPKTVDKLCAPLNTGGEWSCGQNGKAVLNYDRWANGVPFITDLSTYHLYMVNHEVGHNLGHGHAFCGGAGQAAPVMQQQSMGLHGCTAWPWPSRPA